MPEGAWSHPRQGLVQRMELAGGVLQDQTSLVAQELDAVFGRTVTLVGLPDEPVELGSEFEPGGELVAGQCERMHVVVVRDKASPDRVLESEGEGDLSEEVDKGGGALVVVLAHGGCRQAQPGREALGRTRPKGWTAEVVHLVGNQQRRPAVLGDKLLELPVA